MLSRTGTWHHANAASGEAACELTIRYDSGRLNTIKTIGPAAFSGSLSPPPELLAELAGEYGAHLAILDHRLEEALSATGFDGAVIFAGDERLVFRDDQTYPFRIEPYFKA